MKRLLLPLFLLSLAFAGISVSASQVPGSGTIQYTATQPDIQGGTLQLVLTKGGTQLMVREVQNFNGAASGFFSLSEEGTYKLAAVEQSTGEYGEAEFQFSPPAPSMEYESATGPQIIEGIPDYLVWITVIVAAIVVFLMVFGNPLAQIR